MRSTMLQDTRTGVLVLLGLVGLVAGAVRFARPGAAQPQNRLFLVSPPISAQSGDQILSIVFNPTDSMLAVRA